MTTFGSLLVLRWVTTSYVSYLKLNFFSFQKLHAAIKTSPHFLPQPSRKEGEVNGFFKHPQKIISHSIGEGKQGNYVPQRICIKGLWTFWFFLAFMFMPFNVELFTRLLKTSMFCIFAVVKLVQLFHLSFVFSFMYPETFLRLGKVATRATRKPSWRTARTARATFWRL